MDKSPNISYLNDSESSDKGCKDCDIENDAFLTLVRILDQNLREEACLGEDSRESVAYRLSEIIMCSKDIYTQVLPRLVADREERSKMENLGEYDNSEKRETTMFEEISNARMLFIRLKDLIDDFDASFMESMAEKREEEGISETWLQEAKEQDEDDSEEGEWLEEQDSIFNQ